MPASAATGSGHVPGVEEVLGDALGSLFVDGAWLRPSSGEFFDSVDPGSGAVLGRVAEAGDADVDAAVRAARAAFEDERWRGLAAADRGRVLWRIADLVEQHADELVTLECRDQGQPASWTSGMVASAAACFRFYAGLADKVYGVATDLVSLSDPMQCYTRREPLGVAALIVPWNAPLLMASWKVAGALAAGCSAVLKPAELTSLTALRLAQLAHEAGVPPGVLNVVTGRGALTGAALARHEDVDKISFTGSTAVGKELVRTSADTMKRLTLELGGKSPVLVLADADLERAIPAAARAIFSNSGQVCSAGSRLIVADEVADEVVAGVAEIATRTRPGYWSDPDADIGPLISAQQLERVMGYVDGAREAGSGVSAGGRRVEGPGWFVEPTVLTDVGPDVGAAREEIFGPVVVVSRFDDVQEAIQRANDTEYGLAASIWTRDVGKAHAIGRRLRVGRVGINVHSPGDYRLPSGGFKQSGVGREHGPDGLDPYLETKSVFTRMEF